MSAIVELFADNPWYTALEPVAPAMRESLETAIDWVTAFDAVPLDVLREAVRGLDSPATQADVWDALGHYGIQSQEDALAESEARAWRDERREDLRRKLQVLKKLWLGSGRKVNPEMLQAYAEMLQDLPLPTLEAAIPQALALAGGFLPTAGQVLTAAGLVLGLPESRRHDLAAIRAAVARQHARVQG